MDRCIYCGNSADKLTKEHIVPLSFGSTGGSLSNASCEPCAKITRGFETTVARAMYGRLRVRLNMPTRHKRDRPSHFPIGVTGPDGDRTVMIPATEYPRLYMVLRLPLPGIMEGREPIDTNPEGVKAEYRGHSEDVQALYERGYISRSETVKLGAMAHWGAFNRFLAKIAHAHTVKMIGREGYEPLLPPLILGTSAHFSHYIGGVGEESNVRYPLLLELHAINGQQYIVCKVWLVWSVDPFAFPTYQVVVGRVHDVDRVLAAAERYSSSLPTSRR